MSNKNSPDVVGITSILFLSRTLSNGPEALDLLPVIYSPFFSCKLPLANARMYVSGVITVSDPGTMYFPGFPVLVLLMYTFTGIFGLFLLKNKSTPVTNNPPSKFSILKVCASGFGLSSKSVLLATNCTPSFALKYAGFVDTIDSVFSGIIPVE